MGLPHGPRTISAHSNQTLISSIITKSRVMKGEKEGWLSVGLMAQWQSAVGISQRPWV